MARINYSDEQKEAALVILKQYGPNKASRMTGIAKLTLSTWAKAAGQDPKEQSKELTEQTTRASTRAAQERSKKVNLKIDAAIDRVVQVIELSMARELQVLSSMSKPSPEDLRAITSSRTTAMRDFEMLLKRAGQNVGSAEQSDVVETVKEALQGAFVDAGLSEAQAAAVGVAFAHRMRMSSAGEAPTYGPGALEAGETAETIEGEAEES